MTPPPRPCPLSLLRWSSAGAAEHPGQHPDVVAEAVVALLATSAGSLVRHAHTSALAIVFTVVGAGMLMFRIPPLIPVAVAVTTGLIVG